MSAFRSENIFSEIHACANPMPHAFFFQAKNNEFHKMFFCQCICCVEELAEFRSAGVSPARHFIFRNLWQ